jgi:hypothetical protein
MASVATWAAIFVSLIAAIGALGVGGIIGARITARKEFEQQLRERMFGAGDDFIGASNAALSSLRALEPTVEKYSLSVRWRAVLGDIADEPALARNRLGAEEVERVQALVDEAGRQLARVVLIFGPISQATAEAKLGVEKLREGWGALRWYYALLQASESEDVAQRKAALVRGGQLLGEAGFEYARRAIPGLNPEQLGGVAGWLVGRVVTNPEEPLADARDGVTGALDKAGKALTNFASSAGAHALVEPGSSPTFEMTWMVNSAEQIVVSAKPAGGGVRAWLRKVAS